MHIISIVGARPQFVKAAMVAEAIAVCNGRGSVLHAHIMRHDIVHTGQHYDPKMSQVFFDELGIPTPRFNLGVGSGTHAAQTAEMLQSCEEILSRERPDLVLVYGDTNSTLAAALAAVKLEIEVAHVEAGLRSYNQSMPEEINRVLTDHIAKYLFCPTPCSVDNLSKEGIREGVFVTGDVMLDAVLKWAKVTGANSDVLARLRVNRKSYILLTLHRAENTNSTERLIQILEEILMLPFPVLFPMHPRTRTCLANDRSMKSIWERLESSTTVSIMDPVSYLEMLALEDNARFVITDSGGVQKEAYFLGVRCLTLRKETEWTETLSDGWNTLIDPEADEMPALVERLWKQGSDTQRTCPDLSAFGRGHAAQNIVRTITGLPLQIREMA
jgi:UDP-N-acetylglucosamine 2-epimerase (non-hydrolysing)